MQWDELEEHGGGLIIVQLRGEIDLQHSPTLRKILQNQKARKTPSLLLDFTGVAYIDSSGLATLVEYYQSSRAYSGRIALAGASDRVKSIFDLVRLNEIFEFYSNTDEARAGLLRDA